MARASVALHGECRRRSATAAREWRRCSTGLLSHRGARRRQTFLVAWRARNVAEPRTNDVARLFSRAPWCRPLRVRQREQQRGRRGGGRLCGGRRVRARGGEPIRRRGVQRMHPRDVRVAVHAVQRGLHVRDDGQRSERVHRDAARFFARRRRRASRAARGASARRGDRGAVVPSALSRRWARWWGDGPEQRDDRLAVLHTDELRDAVLRGTRSRGRKGRRIARGDRGRWSCGRLSSPRAIARAVT
jgi:hypothetical protein